MTNIERVPNEVLVALDQSERAIKQARMLAEQRVAMSAPKLIQTLLNELDNNDPQVRLRAADILLSRLLPKVAARPVDIDSTTVETADTTALRESIIDEFNKRRR